MATIVDECRNADKKESERRVLIAARKAGLPISDGEVAGEEPDFRFQTPASALGIEVSEVMRPASSNHGILPAEAEAFHQSIMRKAQEIFEKTNSVPTRVNVYFSNPRGQKQNKQQLINQLVEAVKQHRHRANLPAGAKLWLLLFSRVTVARSVPIPAGIGKWTFPFDFDRVFWFACLENRVVEFQRQ
jgi:hypothetical protein